LSDCLADDLVVRSFGPRMVCTVSGAIGADARFVCGSRL